MFSIMIAVCAGTAIAPSRHWKIADFVLVGLCLVFYNRSSAIALLTGHIAPGSMMEFAASVIGGVLAVVVTRGMHLHVPRQHRGMARPTR